MKTVVRILPVLCVIAILLFTPLIAAGQTVRNSNTQPYAPSPTPAPSPLPRLNPVPPEKMLIPDIGIGKIQFGSSIQDVERVFGRGDLVPEEADNFSDANVVSLMYSGPGLVFKFNNGMLLSIVACKPGYATKTGVQVNGDVGDLIREFGTNYQIEKSLLAESNPGQEEYQIFYTSCSALVKGKIIKEIRIRTTKKLRPPKK